MRGSLSRSRGSAWTPAQAARSRAPLLLPGVAAEHGPLPPPWPQAPGAQCPVPLHRHPASPGGSLPGTSVSSAVQRQPPAWPALPSASLVEGPWAGGRGHGASRPGGGSANGRGSAQACLSAEGPGEGMGGTPSRRPVPTETHTPGAAGAPCGLARVPLGSCVDKAALSNEGPPALLCAR